LEAWAPLGQGEMLTNQTITQLANQYKKTPAQILLRWDIQNQVVTIPKSSRPERIIENSQIFDFVISPEALECIDQLDENRRIGDDPDHFVF
jgi:diketogulonate reductase-like aldo/keto reductase